MASMVSLVILGTPKVTFTDSQIWALPVTAFIASPVQADVSVPAGTNSVITVFPTGLNQPARNLYCAATAAQVATAANA